MGGEVFGEAFGEVFGAVFGLVSLGHSEQISIQQKPQPKSPKPLRSKTGENSGKNFMTRFCRGTRQRVALVKRAPSKTCATH